MTAITASRYMVTAGWDDVPHIDEKTKAELWESFPPHERAARTKGLPSMGAGAIYPIDPDEITVEPFQIPAYWPRAYGLDVGWNKTAAIWGAKDPNIDVIYLYTEHYMAEALPTVHSVAIKARGDWIQGVIDPASRGRAQDDGAQLMQQYLDQGLKISAAKNSRESGLYSTFERLSTGRLKVFSTCKNWLAEYKLYRRDENGKVVKKFDHLMDATRYLIVSGTQNMIPVPVQRGHTTKFSAGDRVAGY